MERAIKILGQDTYTLISTYIAYCWHQHIEFFLCDSAVLSPPLIISIKLKCQDKLNQHFFFPKCI